MESKQVFRIVKRAHGYNKDAGEYTFTYHVESAPEVFASDSYGWEPKAAFDNYDIAVKYVENSETAEKVRCYPEEVVYQTNWKSK